MAKLYVAARHKPIPPADPGTVISVVGARQRKSVPPDLLSVAATQHDLLRGAQLASAGLCGHKVGALVAAGALHRLHRGVYKVGTPVVSRDGRRLAAVYAAGPGSAVSHRDAAELHGLPLRGHRDTVSVSTRRGRADRDGIELHRTRRLHPYDLTVIRGIPVTSLARTVLDLADVLSPSVLAMVVHEAEVIGLDLTALEQAKRRARGRNTRALASALEGHRPPDPREIEHRLEAIALRAGLRDPQRNAVVEVDRERFELDRYYPHLRLCLEADGYGVHRTRKKFNSDRRRDRILKIAAGITVLRYTWEDLTTRAAQSELELTRFQGTSPP